MNGRTRLWRAFWLVIFFLGAGTTGFVIIEDYSILDAFYMTIITISTVGFGEIHPLSDAGRTFTIILILSGVGGLAYAIGSITELILERATDPNLWKKPMEKKIAKLKGHTIICGSGRVGSAAANQLHKADSPFVVIESDQGHLNILQELGYLRLDGDATRESILLKAGIKNAKVLLAMLDSDPNNLFTVLTARELNPTLQIIARCENFSSEKRILRAGADSIVSPYVAAGKRVARRILETPDSESDSELHSPAAPPRWLTEKQIESLVGKTVSEAENVIHGTIVGIHHMGLDNLMPSPTETIAEGSSILTIAAPNLSQNTVAETQQKAKIVLIDDNPVICRLYTRLFQKAGFLISFAQTGEEGFAQVVEDQPDAVIIDYHLPDVSGLEVCKKIRAMDGGKEMKVILFTADEDQATKDSAIAAGVDSVVVKSPNADEIVSKVKVALHWEPDE